MVTGWTAEVGAPGAPDGPADPAGALDFFAPLAAAWFIRWMVPNNPPAGAFGAPVAGGLDGVAAAIVWAAAGVGAAAGGLTAATAAGAATAAAGAGFAATAGAVLPAAGVTAAMEAGGVPVRAACICCGVGSASPGRQPIGLPVRRLIFGPVPDCCDGSRIPGMAAPDGLTSGLDGDREACCWFLGTGAKPGLTALLSIGAGTGASGGRPGMTVAWGFGAAGAAVGATWGATWGATG